MRVVVSGATGVLGRVLVPALAQRDHEIVVFARSSGRAAPFAMLPRVFVEQADIRKGGNWQTTLANADVVIHLAAPTLFDGPHGVAQQKAMHAERLRGVQEMVKAIQQAPTKPRLFLVASSVAVYGERAEVVDERSTTGTGWLADMFRAAEDEAAKLRPHVRVVPLRFGQLLGPHSRLLGVTSAAALPPASKVPFTFIHVADAASLIVRALTSTFDHPLNVVAPHTNIVALHQALRVTPAAAPSALGRLFGKGASTVATETLLAGQAVRSAYAQGIGFDASFATLDAVVKASRPRP